MTEKRVETTTVMFTDLVGSTELRSAVGEDEAERLRSAHDTIVEEAVTAHEGVIVKHLGDGAMATFTASANAVAAAVALQQGIDLHNRHDPGERLSLRIGISVGDVTIEDDDYFGLPVIEAQRLESSADPDTIRCAELVKHLAKGRGDHDFTDLGGLDLNGLPEPLSACEVVWSPLPNATAPLSVDLPPVLALAGGLPFSGRSTALDELVEGQKACAGGSFATVLLAGEPGIGKTRLAHELARRVQSSGGLVLAGRCDEDVRVPFQAIGTALDWFLSTTPSDSVTDLLGRHSGDLVRVVPDIADRVGELVPHLDAEPEAERYRLFQAVESWLSTCADGQPTLLVVDDLHWADKPTLLLLKHLIASRPQGLMVVCTYRDTDVDRSHPLMSMLADFRRTPSVSRIALTGLGADEVREFLERAGGHELDETALAFADIVERETAGNPFFVGELLRHLAESGQLVREGDRWVGTLSPGEVGVPEGIREVVGRRLGRLDDETETALRAAAVIGYEFDVRLLALVASEEIDDLLDALDAAIEANLIVEIGVDRFRFSHALVRETLHDELSSTRRARQHRRVAEALEAQHGEDLSPVLSELAMHWQEATIGGDPSRAIELSIAAGVQATKAAAPENAVRFFQSALEMMEDDPTFVSDRRGTMVSLAEAQVMANDQRYQDTIHRVGREAISAGDVEAMVQVMTLHWRTSFSESNEADTTKIELLRDALASLELSTFQRANLLGELRTELIFTRDIVGQRETLDEFTKLVDQLADEEKMQVLATPGRVPLDLGSEEVSELMALFETLPSAESRFAQQQLTMGTFLALFLGDIDAVRRFVKRASDGLAHLGLPSAEAASISWKVIPTVIEGDLATAERQLRQLAEMGNELDMPETFVYEATNGLAIARERGATRIMVDGWAAAALDAHPSSAVVATYAFLLFLDGDVTAARSRLDAFDPLELPDDGGYWMAIGLMSEVAARLGSPEQCARFIKKLLSNTGLHAATGGMYLGAIDRLLALLFERNGEHATADVHFARAVDQHAAFESPPWVARTHLDWAEALLARGERERAHASLDAATAALDDLDLPESRGRLEVLGTLV